LNPDFVDLLRAFVAADVRFLIVGAYALATFDAPSGDINEQDFSTPGVVYQIGVPPGRIDILTDLTGVTFQEAWDGRVRRPFGDVDVEFIGREAFLRNKRATGRPKDLGDIDGLE